MSKKGKSSRVVNSVADLRCERHPRAMFEIVRQIPGTGLNIYQCIPCGEDRKHKTVLPTLAYQCPTCGVVEGALEVRFFHPDETTPEPLRNKDGETYSCVVCHNQIGARYWNASPVNQPLEKRG